jgi:hypothetical protein
MAHAATSHSTKLSEVLMFGTPLKTRCVSVLAAAKMTSPAVAHELAITTAHEKRFAIFSRVAMALGAP